jgi:hypothetical protein
MEAYIQVVEIVNSSSYKQEEKDTLIEAIPQNLDPTAPDKVRELIARGLPLHAMRVLLGMLPRVMVRRRVIRG